MAKKSRILIKVPVRYAPILGLPYNPGDKEGDPESAWEKSHQTISIDVTKGVSEARARGEAAVILRGYGIPAQAARSLVNRIDQDTGMKASVLLADDDPRQEGEGRLYKRLETQDPAEIAKERGREGMPTGVDTPRPAFYAAGSEWKSADEYINILKGRLQEEGLGIGGGGIVGGAGDPFGVTSSVESSLSGITIDTAIDEMNAELDRIRSEEAQAKADAEAAEELAKRLAEEATSKEEKEEKERLANVEATMEEARLAREELARLEQEAEDLKRQTDEAKKRLEDPTFYGAGDIREEGDPSGGGGAWDDAAAPPGGLAPSVLHPFDATATAGGGGAGSAFNVTPFSQGGNIGNYKVEDYLATLPDDQLVSRVQTGVDSLGEPVYEMEINPLVAQMLDIATVQNGYISENQIAQTHKEQAVAVAEFQRDAAIRVAEKQGASAEQIATIQANASKIITTAQTEAEKAVATTQAGAQEAVATTQAGAQETAAIAAAQAASPFGYLAQADDRDRNLALQDISSIYKQMNVPELAQAQASGPFGFVGQAPEAGYTPEQINQLTSIMQQQQEAQSLAALRDNPFAAAIYAQQVAGPGGTPAIGPEQALSISGIPLKQAELQAAASGPYGYMQERIGMGDPGERVRGLQEVSEILRGGITPEQQLALAQAPGNPFGLTSTEQMALQNSLARGGLTPTQRLAEVQAGAAPQNMANYLNFIGNPAAVGFAGQSGFLQNMADSPEGNLPASLFGLNVPQNAPTASTVPTNPTMADLSGLTDEQLGFYQGQQAAQNYQTPSQIFQQAQTVTPQGV